MKKWFAILLFGCTTIKPASRPDVLVEAWDNATLTAAVIALQNNVVFLDTTQWTKSGTTVKMKATDSLTVSYLMVQTPKVVDSLPGHGQPNDSIPPIPIDSTSNRIKL